ncbi:Acg family FMN-binding oxidoreductase [Geodermatophilus sp. SYSU D01062]
MTCGDGVGRSRTGRTDDGRPTVDQQEWTRVVEAATRAPSIHNTQPWRFTASGDRLEVRTDPARALPALDPSGRQRVVSCGVAVEFAVVALAAAGHDTAVEELPDPADPDLLAVLTVTGGRTPDDADRALADAIGARHTERAPFLPQAVPAEVVDRLQATAGASRVWVKRISGEDEEVTTTFLLSRAEEVEQREPEYLAELQRWMRSDPTAPDGIPVGAVPGEDPSTRPSNWLVRDFVVGSRPADRSHASDLDPDAPPPPVERPTVVLMGTDGDDRQAWLTAGRALGRVLLEVTAAGLAASPLTQALDWPATRTQLRSRLSLVGHPQMLMRLGYPSGDRSPTTNRRPVTEVLTFA